ncbi:MAG: serine/threonine protein kinase [Planctomycetaceae bacterium]|nr:serine/threonine protein kinase [Planctomycetaceae bacterium]
MSNRKGPTATSESSGEHLSDEELSDEELAQLERAAEREDPTVADNRFAPQAVEHQRWYSLVNSLTLPVRAAVSGSTQPPALPDYDDLQEVGRGGMGIVYRAVHKQTRRTDAIKVIRPDRLSGPTESRGRELQRRFQREVQLAARVAHEHIVPVYQVAEVDGCAWFSMQYVDGTSLRERMNKAPLAPEKAAQLIEQISRAVDKVHRHGILHGDIKPHNILIEADGERPLITDFGLADFIATADSALTVAGTPAYMAPELIEAAGQSRSMEELAGVRTTASDIYSLGATLLAALTGHSPRTDRRGKNGGDTGTQTAARAQTAAVVFDERTPSSLPPALIQICRRCMMLDPEARFATAGELADALSDWLNRPRWNRHFPRLRQQLLFVVAPVQALTGMIVWWLLQIGAAESWVWAAVFSGYPPLFLAFAASQRTIRAAENARRELWSIWTGHLAGTLASLISLRIICHPDTGQTFAAFYPIWAGLSSAVFFTKGGNFWPVYRWVGAGWMALAVLLSFFPTVSPVVFGIAAAVTCITIALGDQAFQQDNEQP